MNYKLKFRSFLLNYVLKINDVQIMSEEESGNLSVDFYINEWIFTGENILQLNIQNNPADMHESALIQISLIKESKEQGEITLAEIDIQPSEGNPGIVFKPFLAYDLPYKIPDHDHLQKINVASKDLMMQFYANYNVYYNHFKEENIGAIMSYHKERLLDYENRYKEEHNKRYDILKDDLQYSFQNEHLLKRIDHLITIKSHLYGKLITVEYIDDKIPLVSFTDTEATYTRSYPTFWALNENEEFFIYR